MQPKIFFCKHAYLDDIVCFCNNCGGPVGQLMPSSKLRIVEKQMVPHGICHTGWNLHSKSVFGS